MQNPARELGLGQAEVELFDYFCYILRGTVAKFVHSPCDRLAMELVRMDLMEVKKMRLADRSLCLVYRPEELAMKKWAKWHRQNFSLNRAKTKRGRNHARKYPNRYLYEFYKPKRQAA